MSGEPRLPAGVQTVPETLAFWARRTPAAPALARAGDPPVAFASLWGGVSSLAGSLNRIGLGRSDRVVLLLPDGPLLATALLGTMTAAVAIPFPETLTPPELDGALCDLHAGAAIVGPTLPAPSRAMLARHGVAIFDLDANDALSALTLGGPPLRPPIAGHRAQPDDMAVVTQTSGTTSRPKRVPKTHAHIVGSSRSYRDVFGLGGHDRLLSTAALPLSLGQWGLFHAVCGGAATIFPRTFDLPAVWDALVTERPTWLATPSSFLELLAHYLRDHPDLPPPPALRLVRVTAAPIAPETCTELEQRLGAPILPSYASSEAGRVATTLPPPAPAKPGAAGQPEHELRFVDERGVDVPAGMVGEILVREPKTFTGYLDDPELTAAVLSEDGWYHTGDVGYLDGDGFLFLTGRVDELINRGGEKISPHEVDWALLGHPAVADAAVFAVPDLRLGEEIVAAIVLLPGKRLPAWELRDWLLGRLRPVKVPRRIWEVEQLPRTASGKVQRGELARRWQEARG